ncbi:Pre-mRNA-processing factor 6, partial [Bonamia ostreae]
AAKLGKIVTARAIYSKMLQHFPNDSAIWWDAIMLEKNNKQDLVPLLQKGVKECPSSEALWLLLSKTKWLNADLDGARQVLASAAKVNSKSESICLAAVKLEFEENNFESARKILETARERINSARIWMKSALLEREMANFGRENEILLEAVTKFPKMKNFKVWLMLCQSFERLGDFESARNFYVKSVSSIC